MPLALLACLAFFWGSLSGSFLPHTSNNPASIHPKTPTAIESFNVWTQAWSAGVTHEQQDIPQAKADPDIAIAKGVALAQARLAELQTLIQRDPARALAAAIPYNVRVALPREIQKHLETIISARGNLRVVASIGNLGEPTAQPIHRVAEVNGKLFDTHVVGDVVKWPTREGISIQGIAVGHELAMTDSPIRVLQPGEPPTPGKKISPLFCPVSGLPVVLLPTPPPAFSPPIAAALAPPSLAAPQTTLAPPAPTNGGVAVESGDTVYYLCCGGHIEQLRNSLLVAEAGGATSSGGAIPALTTGNLGTKKLLYILAMFSDQSSPPASVATATSQLNGTASFIYENSYHQTTLTYVITPAVTLPHPQQWYIDNDVSGYFQEILTDARAAALAAGYNTSGYDLDAVRYNGTPGNFGGQAFIGNKGAWIKGDQPFYCCHEFGHNFGLYHANTWVPNNPDTIVGPGSNNEYGDLFNSMAAQGGGGYHYNTCDKNLIGWLPQSAVQSVTSSGLYVVTAHDQAALPAAGQHYALKMVKDSSRTYWLEYRQNAQWASNLNVMNGVQLLWGAWANSNGGTQLLDTTPRTAGNYNDPGITLGVTYADPGANLYITPVSKNATTPPSINVQVNLGPFPNNHAPVLTLSANQVLTVLGAPVALTANATDADGDTLAYSWDFGDQTYGTNSPAASKGWTTAGTYRVRCVASDMKGGSASASVLITVTTPGFTISGTARDCLGNPLADVWVTNGLSVNDGNYRSGKTDTNGTYTLTNVTAGNYTMAAFQGQFSFSPQGFANPVVVGDSISQVNFVGAQSGFNISGQVYDSTGTGIPGVIVSDGTRSEPTNSGGYYTLANVPNGVYTLTATKANYTLAPASFTNPVYVSFAGATGNDFFESTATISGKISGTTSKCTITDGAHPTLNVQSSGGSNNTYVITLPKGTWNLQAILAGSSIQPTSSFTNPLVLNASLSGKNFQVDATTKLSITGRITDLGTGLANVSFTLNSTTYQTDSRGYFAITNLPSGGDFTLTPVLSGYTFTPASYDFNNLTANVVSPDADFATTRTNTAPQITAVTATPSPVTSAGTILSVTANDDAGESSLLYTWTTLDAPPAPVTFQVNGSHSARVCLASLTALGTYNFQVTATDQSGATATGTVSVTVNSTAASIALSPGSATLPSGGIQQFSTVVVDQFGTIMNPQPAITWSAAGAGTIDSSGLFTANSAGAATVTAALGTVQSSATITVGYPEGPGTGITRDFWLNVSGNTVASLTGSAAYAGAPSGTGILTPLMEAPSSFAQQYGQRLQGYYIAPATGAYTFYIASADASELWLSTNGDPANAQLIAHVDSNTASRAWNTYSTQQSAPIMLTAGNWYYIKALHKQQTDSDCLAVAAELPGGTFEAPIPSHRLMPWDGGVPAVCATATTPTGTEGSSNAIIKIIRPYATSTPLTVQLSSVISGAPQTLVTALPASITIPANSLSVGIPINFVDDSICSGIRTVTVTVQAGTGYTPNAAPAVATIFDNDTPTASIVATDPFATKPAGGPPSAPAQDDEDAMPPPPAADLDTGTFTITLSGPANADLTIPYNVAGTAIADFDYAQLTGSVTIPAGATSATVTVTPLANALREVGTTVVATLTSGTGYTLAAPSSATVLISDPVAASPPTLTASLVEGRNILLQWSDPYDNEDGYTVQRRIGHGAYADYVHLPPNTITFTDSNLNTNTLYTYRVTATLGSTNAGYTNEAASTTLKYGDTNGDGVVNLDDVINTDMGYLFGLSGWANGDFNGDGVVNAADFQILNQALQGQY